MKARIPPSHILVWIAIALLGIPAWSRQMPRGSFLVKPAHSATQLVAQIKSNPAVAGRFSRHFKVPAEQFAQYVQNHLGLRRLTRNGTYRVFFVRSDGGIGSQKRYLRRGTSVFVHLRSGKPILLGECGNPLTSMLPGLVPSARAPIPPRVTLPPVAPPSPPATLPAPVATVALDAFEPPLPLAPQPEAIVPWQADPILSVSAPALPEMPSASRRSPNLFPFWLAGILALIQHSAQPAVPPSPPVIPEPSSVGALITALALLAGRQAYRRWRH